MANVVLTIDEVQKLVDHAEKVIGQTAKSRKEVVLAKNAHTLSLLDTCISVTVEDGEACFEIPVIGKDLCIPVPDWVPNGTAVSACVSVSIVPPKACLKVTALGIVIYEQCFGV